MCTEHFGSSTRLELSLDQLDVPPALLDQLIVRPALLDPPVLEHKDPIGVADGGETVGDGEGRSTHRSTVDRALNEGFGLVVEGLEKETGQMVQQEVGGEKERNRAGGSTHRGRFVEL